MKRRRRDRSVHLIATNQLKPATGSHARPGGGTHAVFSTHGGSPRQLQERLLRARARLRWHAREPGKQAGSSGFVVAMSDAGAGCDAAAGTAS
jgi:hypothetical protein